ncbi:FBXO28 [Cordylochernes scorpioides]|uniref:FBXO28 n=1 Tax=Cordylochernes scorpioides TaxID=51811 RepID=A0ABY6KJN1_9ARAC|nr:FBXO28 [Cordylochernes scorpioides]
MTSTLLSLPDEILDNILSYFSFDEISRLRLTPLLTEGSAQVCRALDAACQRTLNLGFLRAERAHATCLRSVKSRLPRRESERKYHHLARHCEILTAMETRLSLLAMTFMKYIDMNLCCFIPGKVIDEIYRVLKVVQGSETPPRAHEILQELRDISSMAMEHFDEHIVPRLKLHLGSKSLCQTTTASSTGNSETRPPMASTSPSLLSPGGGHSSSSSHHHHHHKKDLHKLHLNMRIQNAHYQCLRKEVSELTNKLAEYAARLTEQEGKVADLTRKLFESERRFSEVLQAITPNKRPHSPEPDNTSAKRLKPAQD